MQSTAIVFVGPQEAVIQSLEMPPPAAGEVQVRTEFSTISAGTEGWIFRNQFTWTPPPFPCVPGYQRVGTITEVGAGVQGFKIGDRVMAVAGSWEGEIESFWGSHIALANTPVEHLFLLSPDTPSIDASSAVVAQVGYNAASRAVLQAGDWVLVYGDGLIGQCAAQAARARGLRVMLVGHRAERLSLAAQHSADVAINSHEEDVGQAVLQHTAGKPVAAVLDSVQAEAAQREYIELLEPGLGQIVYCGFTPGTAWADMGLLQQKELTTHFVAGWNRPRMESTLALMAAGRMRIAPLITHLVPHTHGPEMYRMIIEKSEPFLGITLDWTGEQ